MAQRLLTRKEFLKEAFTLFRKSEFENQKQSSDDNSCQKLPAGTILPPGAGSITDFMSSCTQCYDCVSACPHEAIRVVRDEHSDVFGFPVIQPRSQPCYECEDVPCIGSCTDGALNHHGIISIGVAFIDDKKCLAFLGQFCMSCINSCPHSGRAIARNVNESHK